MIKRICDFCGREVDNDITLCIGSTCATSLKIIDENSDVELDVCHLCCYKIKQICKNKELLGDTNEQ